MKKLMIGGNEIAMDEKALLQLSDDELKDACGGSGVSGSNYFRLVCDQCNFKSWWNPARAEEIYLVDFHKQLGCNGVLKYEIQRFEFNPNLVTG